MPSISSQQLFRPTINCTAAQSKTPLPHNCRSTMPCGHLNAMRFAQKPLPQPAYSFVHVPKATKTLENSSLQIIKSREAFQTCMAEMLLLSKEAVRRRSKVKLDKADTVVTNSGAKPLSLEYLADRMDVDEVSALCCERT